MVVRRRRLRAILMPLALYALSAAGVAYFVHHAHSGNRGLDAKRALKIQERARSVLGRVHRNDLVIITGR
jgi:hypothetical protein